MASKLLTPSSAFTPDDSTESSLICGDEVRIVGGCWCLLLPCRYGASVDSQMSTVLEIGTGSVAALTILYLEVRSICWRRKHLLPCLRITCLLL
jgi:hypothetical protein